MRACVMIAAYVRGSNMSLASFDSTYEQNTMKNTPLQVVPGHLLPSFSANSKSVLQLLYHLLKPYIFVMIVFKIKINQPEPNLNLAGYRGGNEPLFEKRIRGVGGEGEKTVVCPLHASPMFSRVIKDADLRTKCNLNIC